MVREGLSSRWNISCPFSSFSVVPLDVARSRPYRAVLLTMRHLAARPRKMRNSLRYSIVKTDHFSPRNKIPSVGTKYSRNQTACANRFRTTVFGETSRTLWRAIRRFRLQTSGVSANSWSWTKNETVSSTDHLYFPEHHSCYFFSPVQENWVYKKLSSFV